VPVIVDGATVVRDSTDIVAWADAKQPHTLVPADPDTRAAALALEDTFDRDLGPATRRWAYFHLMPMRGADRYVVNRCPTWEVRTLKLVRPVAMALLRRRMKIDVAGVERSRVKIEAVFARVAELLADGRRYLAGDRFSVADLTFASLAAPVLLPTQYPVELPPVELFNRDARDQIEAWRKTPAGAYALRVYAEDR
jgi:glutathione S-transferase